MLEMSKEQAHAQLEVLVQERFELLKTAEEQAEALKSTVKEYRRLVIAGRKFQEAVTPEILNLLRHSVLTPRIGAADVLMEGSTVFDRERNLLERIRKALSE